MKNWQTYNWIVYEGSHRSSWWPVRLGWFLGNKIAIYRKSYGGRYFKIRRALVVLLTSFIEANLKER